MTIEVLLEVLLNLVVAGGIVYLSVKQVWADLKSVVA